MAPKEDGDDKKYVKAASAHFAESIQEFRKIEEIEKKFKKPITEAKARIKGIAAEKKKLFEAELTDKKKIKEKKERNKEAAVKTLSDESKMYQAILNEERKNYQAELIVHAQSNLGTEAMSDAVLKELNETEPTGEDIYGMFVEDGSTPANYPAAFKAFQKFVAKLKPKMAAVDAYALLNKFQMREEVSKEDYVQEAEKGTFDHTLNEFQIRKEVSTDDYVTEAAKGSFDHTSGGFTQEQVKDMLMAAPPKSSLTSSNRKKEKQWMSNLPEAVGLMLRPAYTR